MSRHKADGYVCDYYGPCAENGQNVHGDSEWKRLQRLIIKLLFGQRLFKHTKTSVNYINTLHVYYIDKKLSHVKG